MNWIVVNKLNFIFVLLGLIIVLFIIAPLVTMIFGSRPDILWQTVVDPVVINSILLTFYTALIATAVGCILGVPLAYILARFNFKGKNLLESIIDLPIVVPHTAAGIALLFVFGRNSIAGKALEAAGLSIIDSTAGIVFAMLFVSVPFLIDSVKEGFKKVDVRLENVARSLGASSWQTFYKVSLPLAWRSIIAGNILMWARGISEFGAVIILSYHPMIAPILIYERFQTHGLAYAQPIAALLVIISVIIFISLRALLYKKEKQ